jgi:ribonuclease Z
MKVSRRRFLKSVGLGAAAAGVAGYSMRNPFAASASHMAADHEGQCYTPVANQLFDSLPTRCPNDPLGAGEMRISFLGTSCLPRLSQQGVSVYVEVGPTDTNGVPLDYAMFDCGMGVLSNYVAMLIPYSRMDKIFIAHLHADHMSELSAIYCFGEAADRKSPLYVWGPGPSGVKDPDTGQYYDDGIKGILGHFREWLRWHTESFSFSSNSYKSWVPPTQEDWHTPVPLAPVRPTYQLDSHGNPVLTKYADPYTGAPPNANYDAYALVPIQLDWHKVGGVAYWNKHTGLKITHFPAIHTRKGSVSYKLEWTPPGTKKTMSMIYSGDTKPNKTMLQQARGVDVLVHEMVMPPDQWASHMTGIPVDQLPADTVDYFQTIENSSHTTQAAFGYLLSKIRPLPRLAVATHFQAQDDTIASAIKSLTAFNIPRQKYTFAADLMMLNVTMDKITQSRADVSRYSFGAPGPAHDESENNTPKYHTASGQSDPNAQIDNSEWIPYTGYPGFNGITYDEDGYNYPH